MKKTIYLTAIFGCLTISSQAQFSLKGEVRTRTELYHGNNSRLAFEDEDAGLATQQRSRLTFDYKTEDGLKLVFSPQVIHFWGQMPQTYDLLGDSAPSGPEGTFSVFEAYAEYAASEKYTLKVGRQAISYKDQRWFGALGWAAASRSHDAFVNKFKFGEVKLDVGLALNQTKHVQGVDSAAIANIRGGYKSLQYAWLTAPLSDAFTLDAMVSNTTSTTSLTAADVEYANVTTIGILPTYKTEGLTVNASGYLQSAESLSSYLIAADVTFKAGVPITLGADIVSGNDLTDTEKSNTWLQPNGTNHKFYGFMDFFYVGETPSFGLNNYYAKGVFKTGEKTKLIAFAHYFATNKDFLDGEGEEVGGYLGSEVDLIFDYSVSSSFNLKLGYSTLFADELFESFKSGSSDATNYWGWLQLTFNPKFL